MSNLQVTSDYQDYLGWPKDRVGLANLATQSTAGQCYDLQAGGRTLFIFTNHSNAAHVTMRELMV